MYLSYSSSNFFFFTELLSATNQQANTTFIDIIFFCNGYEDHLTNGGCTNATNSTCLSQQGVQLYCYNSKNDEHWCMTQFVDINMLNKFDWKLPLVL